MKNDMIIHSGTAEDFQKIIDNDFRLASSLAFSGVCALYSNACLFGGLDSVSFKIKKKKLKQRIKQLLKSKPPF